MRQGTSVECYTFYDDGRVELRHGGLPAVNETGTYDPATGTVSWSSEKWATTVRQVGNGVSIDGTLASEIETCLSPG